MGNQLASSHQWYFHDLNGYLFKTKIGHNRFLRASKMIKENFGSVVVKAYPKMEKIFNLQPYLTKLQEINALFSKIEFKNILPFDIYQETTKAGYLIRPYFYANLRDRFNTRPFLKNLEKRWILYQLLVALEQSEQAGICHGDIKTQNVMVTSFMWVSLVDLATFKPVYLPQDNTINFSYYFYTSGTRFCYLAPERFCNSNEYRKKIENDDPVERSQGLTPAMDIFSLGCVIAEMYLEGEPLFLISDLLSYKKGEFDPYTKISKIKYPLIREMILRMINIDPQKRKNASWYLKKYSGKIWPTYFSKFLREFMGKQCFYLPGEKISDISKNFNQIYNSLQKLSKKDWKNDEKENTKEKINEIEIEIEKEGKGGKEKEKINEKEKEKEREMEKEKEKKNVLPLSLLSMNETDDFLLESINFLKELNEEDSSEDFDITLDKEKNENEKLDEWNISFNDEEIKDENKNKNENENENENEKENQKEDQNENENRNENDKEIENAKEEITQTKREKEIEDQNENEKGKEKEKKKENENQKEDQNENENKNENRNENENERERVNENKKEKENQKEDQNENEKEDQNENGNENEKEERNEDEKKNVNMNNNNETAKSNKNKIDNDHDNNDKEEQDVDDDDSDYCGGGDEWNFGNEEIENFEFDSEDNSIMIDKSESEEENNNQKKIDKNFQENFPLSIHNSDFLKAFEESKKTGVSVPLAMISIHEKKFKNLKSKNEKLKKTKISGMLLIINIILSSIRNSYKSEEKIKGLKLLTKMSYYVSDEIKLERIVPYLVSLFNDNEVDIRSNSIIRLCEILELINEIDSNNQNIFSDYLIPAFSNFIADEDLHVRVVFAQYISKFAFLSKTFLDLSLRNKDLKNDKRYEKKIQTLQKMFVPIVSKLLTDKSAVKMMILQNVIELCIFFGYELTNEAILPLLTTIPNDRNWKLRSLFLEKIIEICSYIGEKTLKIFLMPLIEQSLHDSEEFVVEKTLNVISILVNFNFYSKFDLINLSKKITPLLAHPNVWIRNSTLSFISEVKKKFSKTDIHCFLIPELQPLLKKDIIEPTKVNILSVLKTPLSQSTYEKIIQETFENKEFNFDEFEEFLRKFRKIEIEKRNRKMELEKEKSLANNSKDQNNYLLKIKELKQSKAKKTLNELELMKSEAKNSFGYEFDEIIQIVCLKEYIIKESQDYKRKPKVHSNVQNNMILKQIVHKHYTRGNNSMIRNGTSNGNGNIGSGSGSKYYNPDSQNINNDDNNSDNLNFEIELKKNINLKTVNCPIRIQNNTNLNQTKVLKGISNSNSKKNSEYNILFGSINHKNNTNNNYYNNSKSNKSNSKGNNNFKKNYRKSRKYNNSSSNKAQYQKKSNISNLNQEYNLDPLFGITGNSMFDNEMIRSILEDKKILDRWINNQIDSELEQNIKNYVQKNSKFFINKFKQKRRNNQLSSRQNSSKNKKNNYDHNSKSKSKSKSKTNLTKSNSLNNSSNMRNPNFNSQKYNGDSLCGWRPKGILATHLHEHSGSINKIAVSPDQYYFATASNDGTVKIWSSEKIEKDHTNKSQCTYSSQKGRITGITILNNSQLIASSSDFGTIHLSDLEYTYEEKPHSRKFKMINSVIKNPNEGAIIDVQYIETSAEYLLIYATQFGSLYGWDLKTSKESFKFTIDPKFGLISCFCIEPGSNWLVVGTYLGYIQCWDLRFLIPFQTWRHPSKTKIFNISYYYTSYHKFWISVTTGDNEVSVWNVQQSKCRNVYRILKSKSQLKSIPDSIKNVENLTLKLSNQKNNRKFQINNQNKEKEKGKGKGKGKENGKGNEERKYYKNNDRKSQGIGEIFTSSSTTDEENSDSLDDYSNNQKKKKKKLNTIRTSWIAKDKSYMITAGSDAIIRYWDLTKITKSYTISGSIDKEIEFNSSVQQAVAVYSTYPKEIVDQELGFIRHQQESKNLKSRVSKLKAEHRDAITSINLLEYPSKFLISGSRDGVVKVWK
ncbi:phosphoinositide 3-kinase regulatory subunit 4 [Anaeramoeba flamelloides]|uniref:non-specific serine/threonine protein kinase n=1 Tax=Anaeramoeba flamelloides TaxID=1746091 RepID=A0ABQ8XYX0_9EUKA|nr:phosphoinositide 3-kinase regulatory subunit 4 [Anaeramoeba flamelloides]